MRIPLVTEIQRFCLQDGPGIRSTVFLKGCPLHCPWCHNPETQNPGQEYYFYEKKCSKCGRCEEICPQHASTLITDIKKGPVLQIDRDLCIKCMQCVEVCPSGARSIVGQRLTLEEIERELLSDIMFYRNSGGGITISGGEPLFYPEFTRTLARNMKSQGVHVAIETCCFQKWEVIESLLDSVDIFIVDIKTLNKEKHKEVVGGALQPILDNIECLLDAGALVRIHLPLIPGFNDSEQDFQAYLDYFEQRALRFEGVDLLPFHSFGEGKYTQLGMEKVKGFENMKDMEVVSIIPFANALKKLGVKSVTIGGMSGVGEQRNAVNS